jgi:hypothetical protein
MYFGAIIIGEKRDYFPGLVWNFSDLASGAVGQVSYECQTLDKLKTRTFSSAKHEIFAHVVVADPEHSTFSIEAQLATGSIVGHYHVAVRHKADVRLVFEGLWRPAAILRAPRRDDGKDEYQYIEYCFFHFTVTVLIIFSVVPSS